MLPGFNCEEVAGLPSVKVQLYAWMAVSQFKALADGVTVWPRQSGLGLAEIVSSGFLLTRIVCGDVVKVPQILVNRSSTVYVPALLKRITGLRELLLVPDIKT